MDLGCLTFYFNVTNLDLFLPANFMAYLESVPTQDIDVLGLMANLASGDPDSLTATRRKDDTTTPWEVGLTEGLAEDGGLYVLKNLPEAFDATFFAETLPQLETYEVSAVILRKFVPRDAVSDEDLLKFTKEAHGFNIPVEDITAAFAEGTIDKVLVAWLDQGPTGSFKDFAAGIIGQLMEWWCKENDCPKNIIVATSGDTGVAIAKAFAGSSWVTVTVLYPSEAVDPRTGEMIPGVQPEQERQMVEVDKANKNISCHPTEGNFDRAQEQAKILQEARDTELVENSMPEEVQKLVNTVQDRTGEAISGADAERLLTETKNLDLSSANSINIWRLIPQITQYFKSYGDAVRNGHVSPGEKVVFAVPTGNVGHLMAGLYAQEMGLPVERFVLGTNQNDIMSNFINTGILQQDKFVQSYSNSMDIENPSNLERMMRLARDKVDPTAKIDFEGLKNAFKKDLREGIDPKDYGFTADMWNWLAEQIEAGSSSDEATLQAIKEVYEATNGESLLEAHGAALKPTVDKLAATGELRGKKVIYFETAAPGKTPAAIEKAGIDKIPEHYRNAAMEAAEAAVPNLPEQRRDKVSSLMAVMGIIQKANDDSAARREAA